MTVMMGLGSSVGKWHLIADPQERPEFKTRYKTDGGTGCSAMFRRRHNPLNKLIEASSPPTTWYLVIVRALVTACGPSPQPP
jgi:hypothetical protein